ncbi:PAS domain S-box protein [Desulfosporosinus hippei]|uniref:histidine kinase n=1 Tax=Desulfosporosinus hippei DSM 8344 TaxID=1121419 RepID=A0A1G8FU35_9FIRM|nr:PAS domain S-box protein [Desulfosporosinus hippei]SDH85632.1 PAS domain S-box-containing protein [Desulfosporosinus hippei DSM 8344]
MNEPKTFTDKVLHKITTFIVITIFLWSIVVAFQSWNSLRAGKEKELLSVSTLILNQVTSNVNDLTKIKENEDLTHNQKILAMNNILQGPIGNISIQYQNAGMGYYDIELNSVITFAPNFDPLLLKEVPRSYPYFKSYESGKPEFVINDTSVGWSGKSILCVTLPVVYQGKIIGLTWTNLKIDDLYVRSIFEAAKIVVCGLIIWFMVLIYIRNSVGQTLNLLNDFSQQIIQERQDEAPFSKIPELTPVLVKLQQYTNSLKELNNQYNHSISLLNTIIEGITDGFYALDNQWRFTYINKGAQQATFKQEELIRKNIWEVYPQAVDSDVYVKLHEAKSKNIPMHWETNTILTDKRYSFSAYPYPNGITVFFRDIKEEKHNKEKLNQLAAIVESSNDAIISMALDGVIMTWNSAAETMFGYNNEEVIGKNISILVPEGLKCEEKSLDVTNYEKGFGSFETLRKTKQGRIINVLLSVAPLIDEKGTTYGASTIFHDITNHINLEKKLKEEIMQRKQSEAHLKAIFDNTKLGIGTINMEGKILKCNRAFEEMIGYTQEELCNMDWMTVTHPEDIQKDRDLTLEVFNGKREHYELERRYLKKDGRFFWGNLTIVRSVEPHEFAIAFVQDITEKKLYEEQMAKFDRLNLIGEMAAGISHEVRNPMTVVRGFLQMLQIKEGCLDYSDYFKLMIDELDRANSIITEFLSIGRNTLVDCKNGNINKIIESLKPLIEADAYTQDKYLDLELSEVPNQSLNHNEIRQLILNLCRNGLDSMTAGGTLKIKTQHQENKTILTIEDEGEGIKPDVLDKLGTPFFTTKKNGTGLGLGICYSIAARHNATINIETGPKGTTFSVEFKVDEFANMVKCDK